MIATLTNKFLLALAANVSEQDVLDVEFVVAQRLVVAMALETPHRLHRCLLTRIRKLTRHLALKHVSGFGHARAQVELAVRRPRRRHGASRDRPRDAGLLGIGRPIGPRTADAQRRTYPPSTMPLGLQIAIGTLSMPLTRPRRHFYRLPGPDSIQGAGCTPARHCDQAVIARSEQLRGRSDRGHSSYS